MKAVMVMYDTLCRHFLSPYGNDWVKTPNFARLAEKSVTFDTNYVCSLPCMPARRDLHNSRANFLQRDWGPLEPFDDSMPEILRTNGVYSCLISDHYHYWEDGGCTYHTRYNSWIGHRGQEGDYCRSDPALVARANQVGTAVTPYRGELAGMQDGVNRAHMHCEADMPQAKTFRDGLEFLRQNHDVGSWFLQIETFDPHEPYFTQPEWKALYPMLADYTGHRNDWPPYEPLGAEDTGADVSHVQGLYAALVSMCDHYLGLVLDAFDEYDLWKDTMLIVNTDHGFLLGEHGWFGKTVMPNFEEISHTPLFVYDPVSRIQGERRSQLTSALDLAPTLLDYFQLPIPGDMQGQSLLPVIREGKKLRDWTIFGSHCHITCLTDGRYTYYRGPVPGQELNGYDYTLMPTRMRFRFPVEDLRDAEFVGPLPYTKGCRVLKTRAKGCYISPLPFGTQLYDLRTDPKQHHPIQDSALEKRLAAILAQELEKADAPQEQFVRLGLTEYQRGRVAGKEAEHAVSH